MLARPPAPGNRTHRSTSHFSSDPRHTKVYAGKPTQRAPLTSPISCTGPFRSGALLSYPLRGLISRAVLDGPKLPYGMDKLECPQAVHGTAEDMI